MKLHHFTQSEINEAKHELGASIRRYFGEVWTLPETGRYEGVTWDCRSPLLFDQGIWMLTMRAKFKGTGKASGRIEVLDTGHLLRFMIFTNTFDERIIV